MSDADEIAAVVTGEYGPLCTRVNLVALNLAIDASDDGQARAKEDLVRLMRGMPTRRQLRAQIEHDRAMERLERMRSGQLEAFAR